MKNNCYFKIQFMVYPFHQVQENPVLHQILENQYLQSENKVLNVERWRNIVIQLVFTCL